ncbi:hypothetical protein C8J56DRAFT_1033816 [Mycena floridula]|nr:hypothetical protein C8J56DRAFT_1033816 [Mycena floridula]
MKLDTILASANAAGITTFLPPWVITIGSSLVVLLVIFFNEYSSLNKSVDALLLLVSTIEKATQNAISISVLLDARFFNEVNESRYQFERSVSQCRLLLYSLSNASWNAYPLALIRLRWEIWVTKRESQGLLDRIKTKVEIENIQRLEWREMAIIRRG